MKNTLYIVDDHKMLLKGLKDYLEENTEWRIPYIFTDKNECLAKLNELGKKSPELPEIIIIDVQLTDGTGFSLVQDITKYFKSIKCVMYSMYDTWGFILQAKDLGVQGYISKVASDEELVRCLNIVRDGGTYYEKKSESIQNELESILPILKKQEKIVFELVLQGKSNKQISDSLFISLHTVENYISYLIKLAGCKNREELIEKYK